MELVYLWVEDYKNIHKQGFNFSPRLECTFHDEYDENGFLEDNCELKINENDNYIKNFFGENINITAIVGKNGSGKSSLLKTLIERIIKEDENLKVTYKDEYGHKIYGQKVEVFFFNQNEKIELSKIKNKDIFIVYWDYAITDEAFIDISVEDNSFYTFNKNKKYLFQPSKIDANKESKIDINEDIQELAFNLIESNFNFEITKDFFKPIYIYIETDEDLVPESSDDSSIYHDTVEVSEHFYSSHKTKKNRKTFSYSINNDYIYKLIKTNSLSKENIRIDFIGEKGKSLLTLSFGEVQLLKILCNISSLVEKITLAEYKNILFLFDELELGLHPQWQKRIVSFLTKIETSIPIQFILTSHSPFLLSDLPKENIIFLKDGKNDYEFKKQTFGANIHTLLSDSFFMEDGLMGEFAKNKINKIIKFLNGDNKFIDFPIEQIIKVIESIGEDLLRIKLLDMYYEKFENDELEREKKQLLEQQKEISKRIKSIEDKQK